MNQQNSSKSQDQGNNMSLEEIQNHPKVKAGIRLAENFDELEKTIINARICIGKMYADWDIVNHKKSEVKKMQTIHLKLAKISKELLKMKEDPNAEESV